MILHSLQIGMIWRALPISTSIHIHSLSFACMLGKLKVVPALFLVTTTLLSSVSFSYIAILHTGFAITLEGQPAMDGSTHSPTGRSKACFALKSIGNKVKSQLCSCNCARSSTAEKYKRLDAKLERKIIELRQEASASSSGHKYKQFRSINSVIMKFPQLKEQVKNLRVMFEQYDEDGKGAIDRDELKKCFKELQVNLTEQEFDDLFHSCDVDRNEHIEFNEFIVLICLIYHLTKPSGYTNTVSRMGSPQLDEIFDTIIQVFFYMDKNGDGKLNKKDIVAALTEPPWERSPSHVTKTRFMELDRDRDGHVSFREFLLDLTSWLGIDSDEEEITITDR